MIKRLWVRISPGAGALLFLSLLISQLCVLKSGPSRRLNSNSLVPERTTLGEPSFFAPCADSFDSAVRSASATSAASAASAASATSAASAVVATSTFSAVCAASTFSTVSAASIFSASSDGVQPDFFFPALKEGQQKF